MISAEHINGHRYHLTPDPFSVLAVEPNIEGFDEFEIIKDAEAINKSDIIVYMVAHKEFKGIEIFGKEIFDFCGVTNGQ